MRLQLLIWTAISLAASALGVEQAGTEGLAGVEEQMSIGAIAVTQACSEPGLQSTTEQWGMHFAQTSGAVQFCCLITHLYEEQISKGAIAVTQACCEPVLQSSTEQWGLHSAQTSAAVHFSWPTAHLYIFA